MEYPLHFTQEVGDTISGFGVGLIPKSEWPPNSPDLNPIENVWSILKERISEKNPLTKQQLIDVAQQEWDDIPQQQIQNIIKSLPSRLETVIRKKGDHTFK